MRPDTGLVVAEEEVVWWRVLGVPMKLGYNDKRKLVMDRRTNTPS